MTQTNELIEIVRGSGNVFAEFGHPGALAEQVKASLAAEIIKAMDAQASTPGRQKAVPASRPATSRASAMSSSTTSPSIGC